MSYHPTGATAIPPTRPGTGGSTSTNTTSNTNVPARRNETVKVDSKKVAESLARSHGYDSTAAETLALQQAALAAQEAAAAKNRMLLIGGGLLGGGLLLFLMLRKS